MQRKVGPATVELVLDSDIIMLETLLQSPDVQLSSRFRTMIERQIKLNSKLEEDLISDMWDADHPAYMVTEHNLFGRVVTHKYDTEETAMDALARITNIYKECEFTVVSMDRPVLDESIGILDVNFVHIKTGEPRTVSVTR